MIYKGILAATALVLLMGACADDAAPQADGSTTGAADTGKAGDTGSAVDTSDAAVTDVVAPPTDTAMPDVVDATADAGATDAGEMPDVAADVPQTPDAGDDTVTPPVKSVAWVPPDDGLYGVAAEAAFPIPLGIPTAGYGQKAKSTDPWSPFVDHFLPSQTLHTPPGVKVLVLHRGGKRIILAKVDLIGIFSGMVRSVNERLLARFDEDVSDELILAATHTHAGPGRFVQHILSTLVADEFDPELYDALVGSITDTVTKALEAEAEAVTVGHVLTTTSDLHNDRRCENADVEDGTMGIIRVNRAGGETMALVVNYAMHGTVLDFKDKTLSTDAPGAVELKVAEQFDYPVTVMYLQSWGGDMAPADPSSDYPLPELVPDIAKEWTRLEALGERAAETVMSVYDSIPMSADAELNSSAAWVPFGLDVMGYAEGEWPHPTGAAYCGGGQSVCADGLEEVFINLCFDIPEEYTVYQSRVSAMQIGDLILATLPGEPVTPLCMAFRDDVRAATGFDDVLVVGYAQDYTGYLLDPEDWAMGGYEGGSNFWGPNQGVHLAKWSTAVAKRLVDPTAALPAPEPDPIDAVDPVVETKHVPEASASFGAIEVAPKEQLTIPETVTVSWSGGDPGVDRPHVVLERNAEGGWKPWGKLDGGGLTEAGYEITLTMVPDPPYVKGEAEEERTFVWTATLPTGRAIPSTDLPLEGELRFSITGTAFAGGELTPYSIVSPTFTVAPH